jgi:pimeloyl-ACP methyl ester carboxylesterase
MIHLIKAILIGGSMQYVSIHGEDSTKPILLLLHGGPGMAQIGVARHFNKDLEKNFMVVNWDQRGAGKSYNRKIDRATMNTTQFVNDAIEVSEYLCKTYNRKKIYLCGHSWGSVIGIKAASKRPDLYEAYIGVGQVINIIEGQKLSYAFVQENAKRINDIKTLKTLENIGPAPYNDIKKLQTVVSLIEKYDGAVYKGRMNKLVKQGTSTKDYSLWDWVWRFNKGIKFSLQTLLPHTLQVNLTNEINSLTIPTYFIMGQNDQQTPLPLVENYYKNFNSPIKNIFVIKECAHMLPFEKPQELARIILEIENGLNNKH